MSVNNLTVYRKAKQDVPKLKNILTEIEKSIRILAPYERYSMVFRILEQMHEARIVLHSHLLQQTVILHNKGIQRE